jgi:ligand-binding sensor domain-containing protein
LFLSNTALAEQLTIKTDTSADGLVRDQINRIVRDSFGFLWFCTSDGLFRFDGYTFSNYTTDNGLPSHGVNDLLDWRGELCECALNMPLQRGSLSLVALNRSALTGQSEINLQRELD